ncbi:hypothetical protein J5N97_013869 [Dioscorea zingiberensis]|uniref:Cupin type-1 domain-containing protein n=1 Tax=Dioscorea zingiberensis TaxID=325984 RepID=A0A9D5CRC1_9LILI|nr:hypothetical protein J5N97_013869 [Dioscorea zingiberensis]
MGHQKMLVGMLMVALAISWCAVTVKADKEKGGEVEESERLFMLEESKHVVKTEFGEVRVIAGPKLERDKASMHIGFISMEPNALFIPQYIDASLILFVRRGEVKVGWIYKDDYVEKKLKMGDINYIPAGSAFYMVNTGIGQRLQIICSIDASQTIGFNSYHTTPEELVKVMTSRVEGPIVSTAGKAEEPPLKFMLMKLKKMNERRHRDNEEDEDEWYRETEREESGGGVWTWRKMLGSLLNKGKGKGKGKGKDPVRAPDSYNLYDREPDYKNNFGWSLALDEYDYAPLKHSDFGVYLVNLTAGSMLAPHVNPRATEFGVVLEGSGRVQVVFPNGTTAMNVKVSEGDVFWVPRYFPFCHIASRGGPMEFFGFTTSARRNRPQFLAGARSLLRTMLGPELAAGFGVNENRLKRMLEAQKESLFLPAWPSKEEVLTREVV